MGEPSKSRYANAPAPTQVDIIFANIAGGETEANYYLTSPHGKLLKGIYMKTAPQAVEHAEERFLKVREFWQTWLHAKMELEEK